jgi:hypothetical protein
MLQNKSHNIKRFLEIIPAGISWAIILGLIILGLISPLLCVALIIVFELYWIFRTIYLTTLLIMGHHLLRKHKNRNWLRDCEFLCSQSKVKIDCKEIYQAIIFPIYKEGVEILAASLEALSSVNYPHGRIIVVLAFEGRVKDSREKARFLEGKFQNQFFALFSAFHPDGIAGETKTKGANATWAGKKLKEFVDKNKISYENVLISCFDADTCVEKEYFGCLTYQFITQGKPLQRSYQPMPVYNNNIWQAPSFARLIEISSTYCQLMESMRLEKFVTFSSHSMSFKTLVDVDYWPVDMISDDSVIYWKAYLHYDGDYKVVPMYITIKVQYRQKRRWAWGVENFPFLVMGFVSNNRIPVIEKLRKMIFLLESHVTWATWAIILGFLSPLPVIRGGFIFSQTVTGYNFPRITAVLFNITTFAIFVWMILSVSILPYQPFKGHLLKRISWFSQWLFSPVVILMLGSFPALDAQTRLALGKYLTFTYTEKKR